MSDIVTRLRNWRTVHLARLHLLMEEAADEIAILQSDNNRRADLEAGMRDGVSRLQAEVEQLRGYRDAAEADRTVALLAAERMRQGLSQKSHCPDPEKAPNEDSYLAEIDRLKATITSLSGDRDLFKNLARQFGEDATRAKKRIEELESGLTDDEREAIASCIADDEAATAYARADTLRGLLERLT